MTTLTGLPIEILQSVLSSLPNRDIKNIRLVCRSLGNVASLRLHRVFLSPHPRDIHVFKAIAKHDVFRERVVEIIYDDARFPRDGQFAHDHFAFMFADEDVLAPKGVPDLYARIYNEHVEGLKLCKGRFVERPDHIAVAKQLQSRMSALQSYRQYQKVVKEQEKVLSTLGDIKALEYGLKRFTNLKRITITPVAHGLPFRPIYETPMIRNFPYGFIYPIPRCWPEAAEHDNWPIARSWDIEEERNKWRGACILLQTFAKHPHHVTELIIDVNQLLSGLSCRIFDAPNQEYENFVSLLQAPNFSRLDLSLYVSGQEEEEWHAYRSGHLRYALSQAKNLQHVSLATSLVIPNCVAKPQLHNTDGSEHFTPLRDIFPLDQWRHLRHFGLSRFIVTQDDLVEFLLEMPPTLRSVDLSFLCFLRHGGGDYRGLLGDIKTKLKWHERRDSERVRITIYIDLNPAGAGHSIDISRETEDFVYHNGSNPFTRSGNRISRSAGVGIQRYSFIPENDRPYVGHTALIEMGYYEEDDGYRRGWRY